MTDLWFAHGQTEVPHNGTHDNPLPNKCGLVGEQWVLPYRVPEGKLLTITGLGVEGYDQPGVMVLALWIGEKEAENANMLVSVAAKGGSNRHDNMCMRIPAGKLLNVRLQNGQALSAVYSWHVGGYLD